MEKVVLNESMATKMASHVSYFIVYRENLKKLSPNFVGALRPTTTNCRVSFIDLYSVFPRNLGSYSYPIQTL